MANDTRRDKQEFVPVEGEFSRAQSKGSLHLTVAFLSIIVVSTPSTTANASLIGVNIFDNTVFSQSSPAAPTNPSFYFFSIGGNYAPGDTFGGATAIFPGTASPVTSFDNNVPQPNFFNHNSVAFPSLSALHTAYNFGTYTITATINGSSKTGVINNYTQDLFTSSIPFLTNYGSLQELNPANSITATYNSYTPASGTNQFFTFFTIRDALTGVTVYSESFLPFTTTSSTVPAGTLMPNTQYIFELDYTNRISGFDNIDSVGTTQAFDVHAEATVTTGRVSSVPEPGSLSLLGATLVGFGISRIRRTRRKEKADVSIIRAAAA